MSGSSSLELVLRSGIDVTAWRTASLIVKLQPGRMFGAGNSMTIGARLEGRTLEDPEGYFVSSALFGAVVLDLSTPDPPVCLVAPLGTILEVRDCRSFFR